MGKQPPGPKLTNDQRVVLLTWLAADYDGRLILTWAKEQHWPPLSRAALTYYRHKWAAQIETARAARHSAALNTGLALKEERVARLKEHADELEAIKWVPDKNGRMWNEASWRETLDEIAQETGGRVRRQQTELNGSLNVYDHRAAVERKLFAHLTPDDGAAVASGSDAG
jgi:hypothetical protein